MDELWGDIWSEVSVSNEEDVCLLKPLVKGTNFIQHGHLALINKVPYGARSAFEAALTHCPDHPSAIVGLSNILLDIYSQDLLPTPAFPPLDGVGSLTSEAESTSSQPFKKDSPLSLPCLPLGLGPSLLSSTSPLETASRSASETEDVDELQAPYKTKSLPLVDRLAARDRAYALLSGLTRLGTGWNYSEAWFTLARAYEESGQLDKAKEVLWWCVELEEATGVRDWQCLGGGGYII